MKIGNGERWALWDRFEVPDYDEPLRTYLSRLRIVQTPWFGAYLHRFDGPDPRPTLHDHPWNFVSVVLSWRGYWERTCYGCPERRVRWLNVKRAEGTHYISRLGSLPTWTLMFVGRRRRVWGYVEPGGTWTAYDQHPHNAAYLAALRKRSTVAAGHIVHESQRTRARSR